MNPSIKPISLQLFTLGHEAEKDFPAVLRRVAAIGYKGVEQAGFFNFTPKELRKYVEDLGMVVSSTHSPWVQADNLEEVIHAAGELGSPFVTTGYGDDEFRSMDTIKKIADRTAQINEKLTKAGLTLVVHNHSAEFAKMDGRIKHEIFAELCPDVMFELDTYWAANFGENDPVEMVRRFAKRAPLLHIKDGPLVRPPSHYHNETDVPKPTSTVSSTLLPVGSRKIDVKGVIEAIDPQVTKWLVVEQDDSDRDKFECVEESYRYLVGNGLALGNA